MKVKSGKIAKIKHEEVWKNLAIQNDNDDIQEKIKMKMSSYIWICSIEKQKSVE